MKKITLLVLTVVLGLTLSACKNDEPEEVVEYDVPSEQALNLQNLPYTDYLTLNNPVVTITVEGMGEIKLQLFPELAPNTVNNFIQYIQDGEYDNNEFHRVVNGFVIQGGRLETPECKIPGEMEELDFPNDLLHYRGVISMARFGEDYNSATSQFFLVQSTATFLDTQYTSFGGIVSGFNVVDFIASMQSEGGEVPTTQIVITSITVDLNGYVPSERICYVETE